MAASEILREYFVKLGFKIDTQEANAFDKHLNVVDGMMLGIGNKLVDAGMKMAQFVNKSAESAIAMDALSQRTRSPVSQLKALSYAANQLGLDADALTGSVVGLADNLANKHGFDTWLKSLGVKVDGQTPAQMLGDLLKVTQQFDPAMQASIWQQIGADPNAMRLFGNHLGEVTDLLAKFDAQNKNAGQDIDEQNKKLKAYGESWRDLGNTFEQVGAKYAASMAPMFQDMTGWLNKSVKDFAHGAETGDANAGATVGGFLGMMNNWLVGDVSDVLNDANDAKVQAMLDGKNSHTVSGQIGGKLHAGAYTKPAAPGAAPTGGDWASKLEAKYKLPKGVLTGVYGAESAFGTKLHSGRADGPFQFTPETAKSYGVDAMDFNSSSEGAAKYIHDLLTKYKDLKTALQAYNIGETQMDLYLKGTRLLPKETQDYPGRVNKFSGTDLGVTQNNTTQITVHGTDAHSTADAVAVQQSRVNSDRARQMQALVR